MVRYLNLGITSKKQHQITVLALLHFYEEVHQFADAFAWVETAYV